MYRYDYVYYTKIVTNRNLIAAHETIPSIHGSNKFVQMQLCVFKISSHGQSIIMPGSFKMFQTFFHPEWPEWDYYPSFSTFGSTTASESLLAEFIFANGEIK